MAKVLTTASTISCGHELSINHAQSQAMLQVNGNPVLLPDNVNGLTIPPAQCFTTVTVNPPSKKCTKATMTTGSATKLKVKGQPVVLDTLAGQTDGQVLGVTPQLLLKATAAATDKLSAKCETP